jgi:hypothetical protein
MKGQKLIRTPLALVGDGDHGHPSPGGQTISGAHVFDAGDLICTGGRAGPGDIGGTAHHTMPPTRVRASRIGRSMLDIHQMG